MEDATRGMRMGFGIVLLAAFAAVGGGVTYLLWDLVDFSGAQFARAPEAPSAPPPAAPHAALPARAPSPPPAPKPKPPVAEAPSPKAPPPQGVQFAPPATSDAPQDMQGAVTLGLHIVSETHKYAGAYVGNKLDCSSCHAGGGASKDSLPLVGAAARFPAYKKEAGRVVDLSEAVNACLERNLNGKPLPADSKEMLGTLSYVGWISKGVPVYASVPWLALPELKSSHKPDAAKGKATYVGMCGPCHGFNGEGTAIGPPVWGPDSYSDGASMAQPAVAAAYIHRFMPKGSPTLSVEQALDLGAFIAARPRPKFKPK